LFCPFAHRANLVRRLKGLTSLIDISIVKAYPKGDGKGWPGWQFPKSEEEYPGATLDKLYGSEYLHDIYFKADKEYKGRYSVPVLWDTETKTIINNESHEILRWLPNSFNSMIPDEYRKKDFYPDIYGNELMKLVDGCKEISTRASMQLALHQTKRFTTKM
jgi:putative glutathione S-transferase